MDNRAGILYELKSPSGKRYIGITLRPLRNRWRDHASVARRTQEKNRTRLACAILKYGRESFTVRTLLVGTWDYLNRVEPLAIASFGTLHPNGYNLRLGGSQCSHSEETRAKMSVAKTGMPWTAAHRANHAAAFKRPEVIARMSASRKGIRHSDATKQRMSKAGLARHWKPTPENLKRLHDGRDSKHGYDAEFRAARSAAMKREWASDGARRQKYMSRNAIGGDIGS